jgi:hypothetical protein
LEKTVMRRQSLDRHLWILTTLVLGRGLQLHTFNCPIYLGDRLVTRRIIHIRFRDGNQASSKRPAHAPHRRFLQEHKWRRGITNLALAGSILTCIYYPLVIA